jgi:hypothetical protein
MKILMFTQINTLAENWKMSPQFYIDFDCIPIFSEKGYVRTWY